MKLHKDKKIIGTGDNCQNTPIGMETLNVENKGIYLSECFEQMFTDQIT
jgi:hypothetical protein